MYLHFPIQNTYLIGAVISDAICDELILSFEVDMSMYFHLIVIEMRLGRYKFYQDTLPCMYLYTFMYNEIIHLLKLLITEMIEFSEAFHSRRIQTPT